MHASESLHCRNLRMAHYIRRNLPQKCCGLPHYWIPWRNARLIHESKGGLRSEAACLHVVLRVPLQMNESKTNASQEAATLAVLNQFISRESRLVGVF
jgi:hypothetical protein